MTNNQPDRANLNDPEGIDVPTYDPTANATNAAYGRVGRAQPQSISPQQVNPAPPQPEVRDFDATSQWQQPEESVSLDRPMENTSWDNTAIAPQPVPADNSYQDQDFAGGAALAEPTMETSSFEQAPVQEETPLDPRRGTIDFGLLILRLGIGALLTIQGLVAFLGLGGNGGLNAVREVFADYAFTEILAIAVPVAQLAAGLFLIFGLVTPLFASIATAVTGFMAIHQLNLSEEGLNIFAWPESVWLAVFMLGASVVVQFTGPGLYSLDRTRGWARRPLASSWIFIVIGVVVAILAWWFGAGVNPLN